jgi:hypothetical protein
MARTSSSPKHKFLRGADEDDGFDGLIQVDTSDYKPGPTGTRMHASLARTKVVRGGLGSGKTRAATEHINALCLQYPGSLHFIGRKDITSLKTTTQKEFLEKVVTRETIESFNVTENTLYYKNGSQVIFREAKDPQKVKSLELTSYMLDEADENRDDEIYQRLDERLRQKIKINGKLVTPPYSGFLVFNPIDEDHWLFPLAHRGRNADAKSEIHSAPYQNELDLEDFRFSTKENIHNLPPGYIENLISRLPLWEIDRLVEGHWGKNVKGKPVIHGFAETTHVMPISVLGHLPLLVGWDFGYGHPAISIAQLDHETNRYFKLREFLGKDIYLPEVVERFKELVKGLVGPDYPVFHYGDPHGADKKDVGPSSIEYLRLHHGIFVNHQRSRIKTGLEEIQHRVITNKPLSAEDEREVPLFLVDPSCRISIRAYLGGYHRDREGKPVKDDFFDHLPDTDRYIIVNNMNPGLKANRRKPKRIIKNRFTGY